MAKNRSKTASKKPTIFWIMQYSTPFKKVYTSFKNKLGRKYDFIDPLQNKNQVGILEKIIPQIIAADFVIADVSAIHYDETDDNRPLHNGNVMFELGVAMAYRKKVVMISSVDRKGFPFDIKGYHINEYNNEHSAMEEFIQEIRQVLGNPETEYKNPVSQYDTVYDLVPKSELEALKSASIANPNAMHSATPPLDQLIAEDPHDFIRDFGNRRGREIYREYITPEKLPRKTLKALENLSTQERAAFVSLFDGLGCVVEAGSLRVEGLDLPAYGIPSEEDVLHDWHVDMQQVAILKKSQILETKPVEIQRTFGPTASFSALDLCIRARYVCWFANVYQPCIPILGNVASNQAVYFASGRNLVTVDKVGLRTPPPSV